MSDFVQSEERLAELAGLQSDVERALHAKFGGEQNSESKDVAAPFPGSKLMPNVVELGLVKFALRSLLWIVMWSLYFKFDNESIKQNLIDNGRDALVSKLETTGAGHNHEIGYVPLQSCPIEQSLAMLSHAIDKPEAVFELVDSTFKKMEVAEAKRELDESERGKQEVDFHKTLLKELGVDDLVSHSRERLKSMPNLFERKPLKEYAAAIKGSIGLHERGSFDWLQVPVWMQAKIVINTISGMSMASGIYLEKIEKNPVSAKYMAKFHPKKVEEQKTLLKQLAELRESLKDAHEDRRIQEEIAQAVEAGRIKSFEVDMLWRVLGGDKKQ